MSCELHLTSAELCDRIRGNCGVYFLDGKTMSGKTAFVNSLCNGNASAHITTGEKLIERLICNTDNFDAVAEELQDYGIICVEDIDFFGGRPATEQVLAELFGSLSEHSSVIVTGIEIQKRMKNMFMALGGFEYNNKSSEGWTLTDLKGGSML